MIRFSSEELGTVTLKFRHTLPNVEIKRNNDLTSMVNNMKVVPGKTECVMELTDKDIPDYIEVYTGTAYTHPSDQYKKEIGRELSLKRAITAAGFQTDVIGRKIMAGYYAR